MTGRHNEPNAPSSVSQNTSVRAKRIVMIGFGNYAKKAHFKEVKQYSINNRISLEAVFVGETLSPAEQAEILALNGNCKITECADKRQTMAKLGSFLKKNPIDGAIVSTLPGIQYDLVKTCLKKELHVLVDKPAVCPPNCCWDAKAASSIPVQFEKLVALADQPKARLVVGAQRRYESVYKFLFNTKPYVDTPRLTAINACHTLGEQWAPSSQPQPWKSDPAFTGGKLSFSGYHIVDVVMWWLQHTNPGLKRALVSATFGRMAGRKQERSVAATLSFYTEDPEPDCLVQLDLSFDGPREAVLESYRLRTMARDRITISRDLPVRAAAVAEVVVQREADCCHTKVGLKGATAGNAEPTCDFLEGLFVRPSSGISEGKSHVNSHRLVGAIYKAGIKKKDVQVLLVP